MPVMTPFRGRVARPSRLRPGLREIQGRLEAAVETFERIRKRDYQYPGVAEKIESLRAQLSERQQVTEAAGFLSQGATQVGEAARESR